MPIKTTNQGCKCDVCDMRRTSAFYPPYVSQPDFIVCRKTKRAFALVNQSHGSWREVSFSVYLSSGSSFIYYGNLPKEATREAIFKLVEKAGSETPFTGSSVAAA